MPSLEQQLYQAIVNNATIQSLLAVDAGGNIAFYDKQIPQQNFSADPGPVYPSGVYQRISSPRLFVHGAGSSQANTGWAHFHLTFFSNAPNGTIILDQIDTAVRSVMQTFDAYNSTTSPPSPPQPGFFSYTSKTNIEPQTQPTLQRLEIDTSFWFSDHP